MLPLNLKVALAITEAEGCIYIADKAGNIISLWGHMQKQIKSLGDPAPSLRELLSRWLSSWGSWVKNIIQIDVIIIILRIFLMIIYKTYVCCTNTKRKARSAPAPAMIARHISLIGHHSPLTKTYIQKQLFLS